MNNLSDDMYISIFSFLTADSMKNILQVNSNLRKISNTQYIWNKVYKNTIPDKFINYGHNDFRNLLHQHLKILKHTEWFKRQLFLQFVFEKVDIDENENTSISELTSKFQKYSNNKFNSLPNTHYWDNLEDGHKEKIDKMLFLSNTIHCINTEYNGKYVHWEFPRGINKVVKNIVLKD